MSDQRDGIWIIDSEARTTYANDRMAEILGTSREILEQKHSFDYLFPEDVADATRLFDLKTKGDSMPFRFRLRRADGSAIRVMVQGTPIRNAEGKFKGIVGTFTVEADGVDSR